MSTFMRSNRITLPLLVMAGIALALGPIAADARGGARGGGGGGHAARATSQSSINQQRSTGASRDTVNSNTVNRNTNVNVDRDVNVDNGNNWDNYDRHPVAAGMVIGATVAATAAVIGSMVYSLPPSCSTVVVNGISYSQCGDSWYEPQYDGSSVQYVVVEAPH